jgi:hypothetical protein
MNSLYGHVISHIPRSTFEINHTYPNAKRMHDSVDIDKVPLYSYVLVDYEHPNSDFDETQFGGLYQFNNYID